MQNAKRCGCSFQQSQYAGERIRVNTASSCDCDNYRCQETRRPKPCTPRSTCRPCQVKPCAPRPCGEKRNDRQNCRCHRPMSNNCFRPCYDYDPYALDDLYDDFDSCYGPINMWNWNGYGNNGNCQRSRRNNQNCHHHDECQCEEEHSCEENNCER